MHDETQANQSSFFLLANTYEFTGTTFLSRSTIDAVGNDVVVVDASIADVNSSMCRDVSTTTSAI